MNHVERAIAIVGSLQEFADALDISPQRASNWRKRGVPADWCKNVEAVTQGQVTREQLQPDVFGQAA